MSLGLLGDYGSDSNSNITDSDEELNIPHAPTNKESSSRSSSSPTNGAALVTDHDSHNTSNNQCAVQCDNTVSSDPLNFTKDTDSDDEETSNDSNSLSSSPSHAEHSPYTQEQSISLPLPDFERNMVEGARGTNSNKVGWQQFEKTSSVFYNPYKEAEDAKLAILKKHVHQLTDTKPPVKERKRRRNVTGRRKGTSDPNRCSIGNSGDQTGQSEHHERVHPHARGPLLFNPGSVPMFPHGAPGHYPSTNMDIPEESPVPEHSDRNRKKLKRSGVGESLMPAKKFMKTYKTIQAQERPWTVAPK